MSKKEHSAGGVILEDRSVLLILVQNLKGEKIWTFPKGHLEAGETAEQAALREVSEETGWDCEIVSYLYKAEYTFSRGEELVDKDVRWFIMKRVGGEGIPKTPDEILDMKWCTLEDAEKELLYNSDMEILDLLKKLQGPAL
jgi:8-oxo-dGTP pyrophosphatase MutT (NUDIX family)